MASNNLLPYAVTLLECLETALGAQFTANGTPIPGVICLREGNVVTQDAGINLDECCLGQAYVRFSSSFVTGGGAEFPSPLTDFPISACGPMARGVVLEMGVFRCAPKGTAARPPDCDAWTAATIRGFSDRDALWAAACCFLRSNDPQTGRRIAPQSVVFGSIDPEGPDGGCIGNTMMVTVEAVNCGGC